MMNDRLWETFKHCIIPTQLRQLVKHCLSLRATLFGIGEEIRVFGVLGDRVQI